MELSVPPQISDAAGTRVEAIQPEKLAKNRITAHFVTAIRMTQRAQENGSPKTYGALSCTSLS